MGHVQLVVADAALGVHLPWHGPSNQVSPPVDGGYHDSVPCWGRTLAVRGGERGAVMSGDVEEGVDDEVSDSLPQGGRPDNGGSWRCGSVAPPGLYGLRGASVPLRGCAGSRAQPLRRLVVRGVVRGLVWVGGGGRCCRMWGLVMKFFLVAAGGGSRGGVCWQGQELAGVVGVFTWCVSSLVPGGGGWGWRYWWRGGRGWMLCSTGMWESCRVMWVLRVRVARFLRSLASHGSRYGWEVAAWESGWGCGP